MCVCVCVIHIVLEEAGSTVKQRESEQAHPHSCARPLTGHSRDCRHTNTSRVCSRKSRRAGRGFCLHIRLCLKGKSHMLLTHKYLFQSKHHLRHKHIFFKELENVVIGYIQLYYSFQLFLPIKTFCFVETFGTVLSFFH